MKRSFIKQALFYKKFAITTAKQDFSINALRNFYANQSNGKAILPNNGYYFGMQWFGVNKRMWDEDIAKGTLQVWELLSCVPEQLLRKMYPQASLRYPKNYKMVFGKLVYCRNLLNNSIKAETRNWDKFFDDVFKEAA